MIRLILVLSLFAVIVIGLFFLVGYFQNRDSLKKFEKVKTQTIENEDILNSVTQQDLDRAKSAKEKRDHLENQVDDILTKSKES